MTGLANVRVVDTSLGIAGAYCAKLFGDAGADVIKLEPPGGDPLRTWACAGPRPPGEDGALFRFLHHGHRSVVAGDEVVEAELLASADVLICGRAGPYGDPRAVAGRERGLVVVAISEYGLSGPYADVPGSELTLQADSGGLGGRGHPSRAPIQAGGQVTEWCTGAYAGVAAIGALHRARRSGQGELIDVSWCEVANLTCSMFLELFHHIEGDPDITEPARFFETPSIEPTLDGYVGFCPNTRDQFDSFLLLIERPDLIGDDQLARASTRLARWDEWNAIVHAWTTRHTTADIIERAALLRIPVAPVCDASTLLASDHVVARGIFVDDPTGSFKMPRRPWAIDGEHGRDFRPAPRLGEHGGAIETRPRSVPEHPTAASMPLAGVSVLDLTNWWAGPSATGLMAAMGADVIHVESCTRLDGARLIGGRYAPRPQWWELSPIFMHPNANKRSVALDLMTPEGRELVLRLASTVDLVVENFTPRVMDAFDLGWEVFRAANPRLVMVRMPAFGLDGPWRDRGGFAQTMEQMTGLAWVTGEPDDQPRIQRGPCDPNGGLHGAFAALAALEQRDATGVGCLVEAPMFEAALNIAAELVLEHTAYGINVARDGNRSPRAAPQGMYRCLGDEEWVTISVLDDEHWRALGELLGDPSWSSDPDLATAAGRRVRHDELDQRIGAWSAARPLCDALAVLRAAGIPAAPVVDPRCASAHPQFIDRGYVEVVDHPVTGPLTLPGLPFRFASIDRWLRRHAPTLGEHTAEVLTSIGCSDDELAVLEAKRIIGTWPTGL